MNYPLHLEKIAQMSEYYSSAIGAKNRASLGVGRKIRPKTVSGPHPSKQRLRSGGAINNYLNSTKESKKSAESSLERAANHSIGSLEQEIYEQLKIDMQFNALLKDKLRIES